ncbi:hypothetical protein HX788_08835 [Pseudomonas edaphica]|uniref:Glycine zipper family protein n=1 Tax=Pseudomonas edaphica TaxID=2006980 RepID=A0A7Y8E3A2_9PSED|nr:MULTISPECIES: hypothetical protein [Pseudomonas]NWC48705.1 hypothetical protein [Pseudomonas sp. IPO3747]NWE07197.1 hypothetical protein [Pseudomonas edaphica]NWE81453.1 hypothetical protein [Pseudomonas edaphica]
MKKVICIIATLAIFTCTGVRAALECTDSSVESYPDMSAYPTAVIGGQSEDVRKGHADASFWKVNKFCRSVYNWYENRAKCSEGYKLGIGLTGGVFGIAGAVMAAAGTGGVAPGIAAGVAGLVSTTLGSSEKGPLGTAAYEARRAAVGQAIENGVKSFSAAKTASESNIAAVGLLAQCPTP